MARRPRSSSSGEDAEPQTLLDQAESLCRAILARSPDTILVVDQEGVVVSAFGPIEREFGREAGQVQGKEVEELLDLESRPEHAQALRRCRKEPAGIGDPVRTELSVTRADETIMPCEVFISRIEAPGLEQTLFRETFHDISQARKAEAGSRSTISLLEATLESTADGILVVSQEGKFSLANQKFVEMWQIPPSILASGDDEQALEYVLDQLVDPEAFLRKVKELYSHPDADSLDLLEFKDGRIVERYSQPQRLAGKSVGRVWSFRDITERRRAEEALAASQEQLRQAQRLEAVGRLAGGVAHDFNNLLQVIQGYSQSLLDCADDRTGILAGATEIARAAERASVLTRQLLAFSRKQPLHPELLDLNEMIRDLGKMLGRLVPENIELAYDLAPDLGQVEVDPGQMEQVIMNLIANARDALPQGGKIGIVTANSRPARGAFKSEPMAVLSIADDGAGMDAETRQHIFEPFYTTKDEGRGTGLGLATVYGIVKQSGGNISVQSAPGQGTCFRICLPTVQREKLPQRRSGARSTMPRGTGTILLIEDQEAVRRYIERVLSEMGYTVLSAGLPKEAIRVARNHDGQIDLMLTDVIMPQMNGSAVAGEISAIHPNASVLYMSGYPYDSLDHNRITHQNFLSKPFSKEALAGKIRELLAASKRETVGA